MKKLTQHQYDVLTQKRKDLETKLKDTTITPAEALTGLKRLGFGETMSIKLVNEWGAGTYVNHEVWSKIPSTM